jgi:hypothetical protein
MRKLLVTREDLYGIGGFPPVPPLFPGEEWIESVEVEPDVTLEGAVRLILPCKISMQGFESTPNHPILLGSQHIPEVVFTSRWKKIALQHDCAIALADRIAYYPVDGGWTICPRSFRLDFGAYCNSGSQRVSVDQLFEALGLPA